MIPLHGATERTLTPADAERAQALVVEAGWNQLPADWQLMLEHGHGFGIETAEGKLIATALTMPLGEVYSWISMVLVEAKHRRHGLGTHLLRRCLDYIEASGRVAGLDATELGHPVYQKFGFQDVYKLKRLIVQGRGFAPVCAPPEITITPLHEGTALDEVIAWDREVTGVERSALLRNLLARMPQCAWVAYDEGQLAGYVLVRDGLLAPQLGPIVAADVQIAMMLAATAARILGGLSFIDVPEHHHDFLQWLKLHNADTQRGFVRMLMGRSTPFDQVEHVFAIAGPELG